MNFEKLTTSAFTIAFTTLLGHMMTPIAFGQDNVSCSLKSSGAWGGCKIETRAISEDVRYERTVTVNYRFLCYPGKTDRFKVGVALGDNTAFFNFGEVGQLQLEGSGSLQLIDLTDDSFARSVFKPGCSLVFDITESGPTPNQLNIWQTEADRYESLFIAEKTLQSQLNNLSTLNAAFDILMTVVSSLDTSLRQQSGVIEKIKSGETTSALQQIADSSSDTERARALRALIREIDLIRVDDSSEDVLSRSLSPEDLAKVRGVSRPDPDEIRTSLDDSIRRGSSYFNNFANICLRSKSFITIPSCVAMGPW